MPASLPEGAPALVLAVPSVSETAWPVPPPTSRPCSASTTRPWTCAPRGSTTAGAAIRPGSGRCWPTPRPGGPRARRRRSWCPQLVTPHPETYRALREAIAASGANARIGEVFNTNALLAEALHHRLADAGLARADRVRMFSITTSADGIILVTVGGEEAVGTASVTAFLLAARLALPVLAASLDAKPTSRRRRPSWRTWA